MAMTMSSFVFIVYVGGDNDGDAGDDNDGS